MIFPMMFSGQEPIGQQQWTAAGTYSFVVPPGVFYVHCVVIASGGGGACGAAGDTNESPAGGGGALSYSNGIAVTPGETLTVVVAFGGSAGVSSMSSGSAAADAGIKRGAAWLVMAKGGAGGDWASGIGGAGGAAALGVGDVRWSGGKGQDATNFTYGGWSGRYTANGVPGSNSAGLSASLFGADSGTNLGRGGAGGRTSASPGAVGGIRIMWGGARSYPGNAADM